MIDVLATLLVGLIVIDHLRELQSLLVLIALLNEPFVWLFTDIYESILNYRNPFGENSVILVLLFKLL